MGVSNSLLCLHRGHVILKMLEILLMPQKYKHKPHRRCNKSYFSLDGKGLLPETYTLSLKTRHIFIACKFLHIFKGDQIGLITDINP